jgi:uncharacterized membrane protein YdjX (TVP38/TMEM64 family)
MRVSPTVETRTFEHTVNRKQISLLLVIVVCLTAYVFGDGDKLLNPAVFQAQFQRSPVATAAVFVLLYVVGTALSLPVTGILSVISGMIFGRLPGIPLALLACTCGGTLAYLMSRYLLHDLVQRRFAVQMRVLNRGLEAEGTFYLFSLRMVPFIPFWLLSLLAGVTSIGITRFFVATMLGMLPVIVILVNFGAELGAVEQFSLAALFTPGLLLSLTLLATLPLLARGIIALLRRAWAGKR